MKIWTSQNMGAAAWRRLIDACAPHELVRAAGGTGTNLDAAARDPALADCDVAYGQPSADDVIGRANLRWVALSSAGYTRYDRDDVRAALKARGATMTNASGVYDEAVAQHALAQLLALTRRLHEARDDQHARAWRYKEVRLTCARVGPEWKVLLVGYGAIARRLAELLAPFGCAVVGFRRTPRGDEPIRVLPIGELDAHLPAARVVVNVLPSSPTTRGFFDARRLALLPPDAFFLNLGRGDTTDAAALAALLRAGKLAAAALDVTDPEPLPPASELWGVPNLLITPHTAGGYAGEEEALVDHFAANLRRFERGEALRDRIV